MKIGFLKRHGHERTKAHRKNANPVSIQRKVNALRRRESDLIFFETSLKEKEDEILERKAKIAKNDIANLIKKLGKAA